MVTIIALEATASSCGKKLRDDSRGQYRFISFNKREGPQVDEADRKVITLCNYSKGNVVLRSPMTVSCSTKSCWLQYSWERLQKSGVQSTEVADDVMFSVRSLRDYRDVNFFVANFTSFFLQWKIIVMRRRR